MLVNLKVRSLHDLKNAASYDFELLKNALKNGRFEGSTYYEYLTLCYSYYLVREPRAHLIDGERFFA